MNADEIVVARANSYDDHYRTSGWRAEQWTRAKVQDHFAYAADVCEGGYLNGREVQYALRALGVPDCGGMKILDYCCGTGITAIYLALCGAEVWAFDASAEAIAIALESARMSGVTDRIHFAELDAQHLPYENDFFDGAFCQSALHIIIDYEGCPHELARVLKPGGKAIFCEEALGYNPVLAPIRRARRRKYVGCGGRPLRYPDIDRFGEPFSQTAIEHFCLLAQIKTVFAGQLRRCGGLRPWARRLLRVLERFDRALLLHVPYLNRYCGQVVVVFTK